MMTPRNNTVVRPILTPLLFKRMLRGAGIGLVLISLLVLPVQGRTEWGEYWKIRPLIVVPMAGAVGGFCYYLLDNISLERGWNPIWTNILSLLIFIFGMWIGTIAGLHGTMWN